jgi:hypothetical protein
MLLLLLLLLLLLVCIEHCAAPVADRGCVLAYRPRPCCRAVPHAPFVADFQTSVGRDRHGPRQAQ